MPITYSFLFVDEADPQNPNSYYPCFFCQVERFKLSDHLVKFPEHADNLTDDLNQLYLALLALHCTEHDTQTLPQPAKMIVSLSRLHPRTLFYFRLAREWIENLVVIDAKLKLKALPQGVAQL